MHRHDHRARRNGGHAVRVRAPRTAAPPAGRATPGRWPGRSWPRRRRPVQLHRLSPQGRRGARPRLSSTPRSDVDHATLMKGNVIGCLTTVYDSARFGKVETPPGLRPLARAPPHGRRGARPRRGARRLRSRRLALRLQKAARGAFPPPAPFGASATTPSPASAAGPRTGQAPARIGRRARPPAPPS